MTSPASPSTPSFTTPLPSIHLDPTAASVAEAELAQAVQQLEQILSQLPGQIIEGVLNAILNALGLGAFTGDVDNALQAIESGLSDFFSAVGQLQSLISTVTGGLSGVEGDVSSLVSGIISALGGTGSGVSGVETALADIYSIAQDFSSAITGVTTTLSQFISLLTNSVSGIASALGGSFTDPTNILSNIESDLGAMLGLIPPANVIGSLGPLTLTESLQAFLDSIQNAATGATATGNSLGQVANAIATLLGIANNGVMVGQANSTTIVNQSVTKPTFNGVDPSIDAVFPIASLSGATLPMLSVTSAASVIGFIGTPDGGIKESVAWLGQSSSGITDLFINLYSVNTSTGALTLLYSSADDGTAVGNTGGITWNFFDLPTANYISTTQGDWYAVELVVTGSGTYTIAGLSHQAPALTSSYPSGMAATRTSGLPTAPSSIASPTYSTNIPWFGLSGSASPSQIAPQTTEFSTSGTSTYAVPSWMVAGDQFDIVLIGAGGGGAQGANGFGGAEGAWNSVTLTYGTDIPTSTTSFSVVVGAGGAGSGGPQSVGFTGGTGGSSSVTITGWSTRTITAAGGIGGGENQGSPTGVGLGASPNPLVVNSVSYYGGGNQSGTGHTGNMPGGGGAAATFPTVGGPGATGAVWIRAYQA